MAGIYLHIPYCHKACHYCDFHFSTRLSGLPDLVHAMTREIEHHAAWFDDTSFLPDTLYLGGGTPSLLPLKELEKLMQSVYLHFGKAGLKEITLEANPEDVTEAQAEAWRAMGCNRISLGVQSFQEGFLQQANRNHSAQQAEQALTILRKTGFDNFSADVIFGFFGQTLRQLESDLQRLLSFEPPHISVYCLTIEPGTVFGTWQQQKKLEEPDEKLLEEQFYLIREILAKAGRTGYEISNFARPGYEALHNSNYWTGAPYLGIGPSAHSYKNGIRKWNVSNNSSYIKHIGKEELHQSEVLSPTSVFNETILTGLRISQGVSFADLPDLLKEKQKEKWDNELAALVQEGLITKSPGGMALTLKGLWKADGIAMRLFV